MKKIIFLTFDYELFLFKSGSLENCILNPTNQLLNVLDDCNIKAIFFVDSLYLYYLKKLANNTSFKLIENNILKILASGHRVELHLHPHWIDAKYNLTNDCWDLSNQENYQLKSLSNKIANECFVNAYNTLNEITKKYNADYKLSAFRAGGLCIQPFEKFKPLLKKYNLIYESSVAPGMKSISNTHEYDFTKIKNQTPYCFNDNLNVTDDSGYFTEFPINTYSLNFLEKLFNKLFKKKDDFKTFGDGVGVSPILIKNNIINKLKSSNYFYSLDGNYNDNLMIKKIIKSNLKYITLISHPKLMSNYSFSTLKKMANNKSIEFKLYNDYFN